MRNSSKGTLPGATRIANWTPLRRGWRGGPRAKSAHDCRSQPARRWLIAREFRKGLAPRRPDRRVPGLWGPGAENHPSPGLRIGPALRTGPRTPLRRQTPNREATPDRGKSHVHPATLTFPADYQMQEPLPTPPSRSTSARDPRIASGGQHSEHLAGSDLALIPSIRRSALSGTPSSRTLRAEETGDSEDKIALSPHMRQAFTRLQTKASPGSSSLVGGLDHDWKERATPKKPRPS